MNEIMYKLNEGTSWLYTLAVFYISQTQYVDWGNDLYYIISHCIILLCQAECKLKVIQIQPYII